MNRSESKYFNTAQKMDEALFKLIEKKDFEFITVKDICREAGVNRSTFYLHYQTIGDLLDECSDYLMRRFESYFHTKARKNLQGIENIPLEELNFVTPKYLNPYLEFVKDNSRFFQTVIAHHRLFSTMKQARALFEEIFIPILRRYNYPVEIHHYVLMYYLSGMMAVVTEWLKTDCKDPTEKIAEIIMRCVIPYETN